MPGLDIKAAVTLYGVEIGQVESIAFDPQTPGQILFGVEVARLDYQAITGLFFLDLPEDGGLQVANNPAARKPGDRIEPRPSLIDELLARAAQAQ